MYLYVRLVHIQGEVCVFLRFLLSVPVFDDRSISDGYVYIVEIGKYVAFKQSNWYYISISGIWCWTGSVYVLRICAKYSAGD